MTFFTWEFITDRSIVSYQEIFESIPVEDKLATPAIRDEALLQALILSAIF